MVMSGQDLDEDPLERAKMFLSLRRPSEAEEALIQAEERFTAIGNDEKLKEVLLSESKVHLCLGLIPKALEDVHRASVLVEKGQHPVEDFRFHFQRGLVYLCAGQENEAHREMTRYLELTEGLGDFMAMVRGHFYLALIYERHGEPCMAAAELELGRDAARSLGSTNLNAGLTAFLAHLWLRREQIEIAEGLEKEALHSIQGITNEMGTSSLGMVQLVDAEIQAIKSDWERSQGSFQKSLEAFHYSCLGPYFVAFAYACYGETLMKLEKVDEGCRYLAQARHMFEKLSNMSQVERAKGIMAGNAVCSCDR